MPTPHAPVGLNTPRLLLAKVRRDRTRFRRGKGNQADHEISFYITAWHMTDWVWWEHLDGNTALQNRLGITQAAGVAGFQRLVCGPAVARRDYLVRCSLAANGTKHHTLTNKPPEFAATTQIVAATSAATKDTIVHKWDVVDRDTGVWNSRVAVEKDMDDIIAFWTDFFRQYLP